MSAYLWFDTSTELGDRGDTRLWEGFLNGLIIVSVIYTLMYAVLTPYGPLKLLVEEICQPNSPAMTKLLY